MQCDGYFANVLNTGYLIRRLLPGYFIRIFDFAIIVFTVKNPVSVFRFAFSTVYCVIICVTCIIRRRIIPGTRAVIFIRRFTVCTCAAVVRRCTVICTASVRNCAIVRACIASSCRRIAIRTTSVRNRTTVFGAAVIWVCVACCVTAAYAIAFTRIDGLPPPPLHFRLPEKSLQIPVQSIH